MPRSTIIGAIVGLLLWQGVNVSAQNADAPAAEPAPAAKPAAKPKPATANGKPAKIAPLEKTNPAVEAIVSSKPATAEERVRAAKILADLGRADLAKSLLAQVVAEQLNQEQLAALAARFGSAVFREMASKAALLPEAQQLSQAVLDAVAQQAEDAGRLDGLVTQLGDASPEVRHRAKAALVESRGAGVQRLLAVLADTARADEYARVREVLVAMGPAAVDPLVAALASGDANLTRQVVLVLTQLNAREAVIYLLAPLHVGPPAVQQAAEKALAKLAGMVPDRALATEMLVQRARQYFRQQIPVRQIEGQVQQWRWDEGQKQPVASSLRPEDAARAIARRLAGDAHTLAPDDRKIASLYAATILESSAYETGLDKPPEEAATAEVVELGLAAVQDALQESLVQGHAAAAAAAAWILGQKGSAEEHIYRADQPSPLVLATRCGDRRVRIAALTAILGLKPSQPYPGSSFVVEAMDFFAASRGSRRVLAAAPRSQAAMELAGPLTEGGYQIDVVNTGRELIRAALACPDYELALIDLWLDHPTADLLIQQLRRDNRTADLPVLLLAHADQFDRADTLARRNRLTLAFPRPHDAATLKSQVAQLAALAGREFVPYEVRQQQAAQALQGLSDLTRGPAFYPVARAQTAALTALRSPQLESQAMPVLEAIGRPESQRALVELASRGSAPMELRQAAAEAFQKSIQQHGILLTSSEILRQYDRYNQSAGQDEASRTILSGILDSLEGPSKAKTKKTEARE